MAGGLMADVDGITDDQLSGIGVSRAEWADLQPAEREALLIEEDASAHQELTDEDIAAAQKVADDGEPAQGGQQAQGDDAGAAKGDEPNGDAAPQDQAAAPVQAKAEPKEEREFVPMPSIPSQAEIDGQVAQFAKRKEQIDAQEQAIEKKLDAIEAQLEEGDLTSIEYARERRKLDKQIQEVNRAAAVLDADRRIAESQLNQANANAANVMQQRYAYAQEAFYADEKHEALYSHASLGQKARDLLIQQFVPALAQQPDNANRSFSWLLREGDKRVRAFMVDEIAQAGIAAQKAAGTPPPAADRKPVPGRAPDLSKIPNTLANAPVAATNEVGGEFGHLDKLDGMAYLAALEKLSPAQREKYEAM